MNKSHGNAMISRDGQRCPGYVVDRHDAMAPAVFGDKGQKAPSQPRKKKATKPIRRPDASAAGQRQRVPENNVDANGRSGKSSNAYGMLLNDHAMRIVSLENKLGEACAKNHELATENRLLKVQAKRYEHALSEHEGNKAKLPQIIKSYEEEIRTLKDRVRQTKSSLAEMESRYKSQTNELLNSKKQHARLLSLPKKEERDNANGLRDRLEEAYDTIKQQQNEILKFKREIELQNKTHRNPSDSENRLEILALETNAGRDFAKGSSENSNDITRRAAKPTTRGRGDAAMVGQSFNQADVSASIKPVPPRKKFDGKNKPFRNREKWNKY